MPHVPNFKPSKKNKVKPIDQKKMQMIQWSDDAGNVDFKNSQMKQVAWEQTAATLNEMSE